MSVRSRLSRIAAYLGLKPLLEDIDRPVKVRRAMTDYTIGPVKRRNRCGTAEIDELKTIVNASVAR